MCFGPGAIIEQSPERGLGLTNEYVAFHWDHAVIRASSTKFLTVLASRGTSPFLPQFGLLPQVSVPLQKMGGPPAAWDAVNKFSRRRVHARTPSFNSFT